MVRPQTLRYSLLATLFSLLSTFAAQAQSLPTDFVLLSNTNNWCSKNAEFSTAGQVVSVSNTCTKTELTHSKWFRFTAQTTLIEVQLTLGGDRGSLQFPYLSLWTNDLKPLTCKPYADVQDPLSIIYTELTKGESYWISVHNHNHSKYVGTFTMCVNNQLSYDFVEGAKKVPHINEWCSEPDEYSTVGASPDSKKAGCMTNGPNFNRWFTFVATRNQVDISIEASDAEGAFQFPYLALWDENMRQMGCAKYTDEYTPIAISNKGLTTGKRYYISVDHNYNTKYLGSFKLCVSNGAEAAARAKFSNISGRLFYINNSAAQSSISLLDVSGKSLQSTQTDAKGSFRFTNLAVDEDFMVRIEEDDPAIQASVYQTDEQGNVLKRGDRQEGNVFKLVNPANDLGLVPILHPREYDVIIEKGQEGIVGKVVAKSDPARPLNNVLVGLYETVGTQVTQAKTDQNGRFNFSKLSTDKSYMVKMGETDEEAYAEMLILNDAYEAVEGSSSKSMDGKGYFRFTKLPPIAAELFTMEEEDVAFAMPTSFDNVAKGDVYRLKIQFEKGSATLESSTTSELDKLVRALNASKSVTIAIEGHTDNTGSESENKQLSLDRAKTVASYLAKAGVAGSRISTKGLGSTNPVASNASEAGRRANRRVEFRVISR